MIINLPWDQVVDKLVLKYKKLVFVFQHRSFDFNKLPKGNIFIHGHTHTNGNPQRYTSVKDKLIINACPELWDYRPFNLYEVVREFRARKNVPIPRRLIDGQN